MYDISDLKNYMKTYHRDIEFLNHFYSDNDNDVEAVESIIHRLREDFFNRFGTYIFKYFIDFNKGRIPDASTEIFVNKEDMVAIRKFNGYWYMVDIKEHVPDVYLSTQSPDDYPLHIMPMDPSEFPEFLLFGYMVDKTNASDKS